MKQPKAHKAGTDRRWFRFAYPMRGREDRQLLPQHTRDAEAALALQPVLAALGYRYAGPILNYPAPHPPPDEPVVFDGSFLKPSDLLVLTTRPPLHDALDGVRGRIPRSRTALEDKVFACVLHHLAHCSRVKVTVAEVHCLASQTISAYGNVLFRQNGGAAIDAVLGHDSVRWQKAPAAASATMAYLIYERQAWANGPGLLASFGMSGIDTLAWNAILAERYADLVGRTLFLMARIDAPQRPRRPQTLEFVRDWSVQLMTLDAATTTATAMATAT